MRWCRRRRIVWFSHLPSSPRSLARTNVPWLCNQVKVAQAPPSSRHRRLANSRTIHCGTTTTITTTMPPPAPIRPADRPTERPEIRSRFTIGGILSHPRHCIAFSKSTLHPRQDTLRLHFATQIYRRPKYDRPMSHFTRFLMRMSRRRFAAFRFN